MKRILAVIGFLACIGSAQAADNFAATAGSGLTFGAKDVGGVLFPYSIPTDTSGAALFASGNAGYVRAASGAFASGSIASGAMVDLGAQTDAVCGSATGTCSLIQLIKYLNTIAGSAIPAGTNVIGKVGTAKRATPTWTVQAASYSSGNSLGGLITATIATNNGDTGFLTNVRVTNIHADTSPTLTVFLFDTDPTGTGSFACTDKSAYVNDPGAVPLMIAQPQVLTLAVPTGATYSYASADFTPPRPFATGGSVKTIFACVVVNGSLTPNATTDFKIALGAALN